MAKSKYRTAVGKKIYRIMSKFPNEVLSDADKTREACRRSGAEPGALITVRHTILKERGQTKVKTTKVTKATRKGLTSILILPRKGLRNKASVNAPPISEKLAAVGKAIEVCGSTRKLLDLVSCLDTLN